MVNASWPAVLEFLQLLELYFKFFWAFEGYLNNEVFEDVLDYFFITQLFCFYQIYTGVLFCG